MLMLCSAGVLGNTPAQTVSLVRASTPAAADVIDPGNIRQLTKLKQLPMTGVSPTWSPDGKKLAIVGYKEVFVFDVAAPNQAPSRFSAGATIDSVLFSSDGRVLAAGNKSAVEGDDSRVFAWDLHTGAQKVILDRVYNP